MQERGGVSEGQSGGQGDFGDRMNEEIKIGDEVVRINHPDNPERGIVTAVSANCLCVNGHIHYKADFAKISNEHKDDGPSKITECPHPEWHGSTWDYLGEGFHVHWNGYLFEAHSIHGTESLSWDEPGEFWIIKEYAAESSTHEPIKRNDVRVGWDPYYSG